MRGLKQISVAVGAIAALAAATGCGGSTGPLNAGELISQGDELCVDEQERFKEIQVQAPASAADAVDQTNELIEVSNETLEKLTEIEPPSDLRSAYEGYLDARRQALDLLERGREAAERHDRVAYGAAQEKSIAGEKRRRRLARAVGFEVCGSG